MLRDAKFISSIDLRKAFWQISLDESSREKTAFSVPGRGLFHFTVMPFGLCNSAQTQQRLVDALFGPEFEPKIFAYLDDIIITSSTFEEHITLLNEVRERLQKANLTINLKKCEFFKTSLKYLGYVIDQDGLRTDPDKVSAMVNYPRPTTSTEIKRFVGLCSWYRRFIENFSSLVSPLNDLLKGKKKKEKINWSPDAEKAFINIKKALISSPILCSPDFSQPFTVQCDASDTGVGGVLVQNHRQ
jgi:Reverse transcriptase (RNA-dependent DNA polymerase).